MITSLTGGATVLYWSESTPIAELLRVRGGRGVDGLEHALAGGTCGVVDDVGSAVELAAGHLGAAAESLKPEKSPAGLR